MANGVRGVGRRIGFFWMLWLLAAVADGASSPEATSVLFGGFQHKAEGNATVTAGNGALEIANIGSSGLDGLLIDHGKVEGFRTTITSPRNAFPNGTELVVESRDTTRTLGVVKLLWNGTDVEVTPDFSGIVAPTYRLAVLKAGVPVYARAINAGMAAQVRLSNPSKLEVEAYGNGSISIRMLGHIDVGTVVAGDAIHLAPVDPSFVTTHLERLTVRARDVRVIELSQLVFCFGNTEQTAQGNVIVTPGLTQMSLSNIGSSGADGLDMGFEAARSVGLTFDGVDPQALPPGALLSLTALGSVDGEPEQAIVSLGLENSGTDWGVGFDFGPVGAETYTLRLLLGDAVLYAAGKQAGLAAHFARRRFSAAVERLPTNSDVRAQVVLEAPTLLRLTTGGTVLADRIVAVPDRIGVSPVVDFLSGVELRGMQLPSVILSPPVVELEDALPVAPVSEASCSVTSRACWEPGNSSSLLTGQVCIQNHGLQDKRVRVESVLGGNVATCADGPVTSVRRTTYVRVPAGERCYVGTRGCYLGEPKTTAKALATVRLPGGATMSWPSSSRLLWDVKASVPSCHAQPCDMSSVRLCDDDPEDIFSDGFESGDTSQWAFTVADS